MKPAGFFVAHSATKAKDEEGLTGQQAPIQWPYGHSDHCSKKLPRYLCFVLELGVPHKTRAKFTLTHSVVDLSHI